MNATLPASEFSKKYNLGNPFGLDNKTAYDAWVDYKLDNYPQCIADIIIEIGNPKKLTRAEQEALTRLCKKTNMAIYAGSTSDNPDTTIPIQLGHKFGLFVPDENRGADNGITALRVVKDNEWQSDYIPYTNHLIHWHTDGYYNSLAHQINSLFLHCVSPAASGGENALLDHEIAYIKLRQENPAYIHALMAPDAMTIPANINKKGEVIRPDRVGPVFSVMSDGHLHMRYTARTRSIVWKNDPTTQAAIKMLSEFLLSDSPYIYRATLQPGQGLISNNVLHDRSGFEDSGEKKRLIYRLRYYERINET